MNQITCERDYNRLCMNNFGKVIVLIFHAEWHEYSQDYIVNFETLFEMQDLNPQEVIFAHLDAELVPEVALKYNVNNVPTVVFTDAQKGELKKFENVNPALVFEEIENFLLEYKQKFEEKRISMYKKIEKLIASSDVLIFIKGTPTDPECKFTRQFLEIMKDLQCKFTFYDIIADNDMRHWLRHYNKWPTYPQIYIAQELIGGLDKTKQLIADNTIQSKIPEAARIHDPSSRLKKITSENPVILFTEGNALDENQTPETKKTIELLKYNGVKFNCFDVSSDELLLNHIKESLGAFPRLFANAKHLGSVSEIQKLVDESKLLDNIPGSNWQLDGEQKLRFLLKNCPVIAFINGIPKECHNEDSLKVVEILTKLNVVYEFYNVDADSEVLNNLKAISQYDKTPQLYVSGQLIGGAEAVDKLFKDGDLQELTKDFVRKN